MTPKETRGKRVFLVLATLLILENLATIGIALSGDLTKIHWLKALGQPIGLSLAIAFLWQGDQWLQWLVGLGYILAGGLMAFATGRLLFKLAEVTPPEGAGFFMQVIGLPIGLIFVLGILHLLAGLCILFLPSLRAFFRYQRTGPQMLIEPFE